MAENASSLDSSHLKVNVIKINVKIFFFLPFLIAALKKVKMFRFR